MVTIKFVRQTTVADRGGGAVLYCVGETAAFPADVANGYVTAGAARWLGAKEDPGAPERPRVERASVRVRLLQGWTFPSGWRGAVRLNVGEEMELSAAEGDRLAAAGIVEILTGGN